MCLWRPLESLEGYRTGMRINAFLLSVCIFGVASVMATGFADSDNVDRSCYGTLQKGNSHPNSGHPWIDGKYPGNVDITKTPTKCEFHRVFYPIKCTNPDSRHYLKIPKARGAGGESC